jgi:hypothetical protein
MAPVIPGSRITALRERLFIVPLTASLVWVLAAGCSTDSSTPNIIAGSGGSGGASGTAGSSGSGSGGTAGASGKNSGGATGSGGTSAVGSSGGGTTGSGGSSGQSSGTAGSSGAVILDAGGADVTIGDTGAVIIRPDSGISPPPKDTLFTPPFDPSTVPTLMPLFDGKTMTGWNCSTGWTVVDGAIMSTAKGEFCLTKDKYATVRIFVSTRTDSDHQGVGFWGNPDPTKFDNGSVGCFDVMPPNEWTWDYVTNAGIATKAGAISNKPAQQLMKEWTQAEILLTSETGRVRMAVNGALIVDFIVAATARAKAAPIGLQAHGGNTKVYYKDIWVEVNPKEDRLISLKQP